MKKKHMESVHNDTGRESACRNVARRDFLKGSGFVIGVLSACSQFVDAGSSHCAEKKDNNAILRFGIVTDAHYADTATKGTRNYRESVSKMVECVALMNKRKVDFLVELGDFKDENKSASEESTLKYLETIEKVYGKFKGKRYHVLGNHDMDSISKQQFLSRVENTGISEKHKYYSFDSNGLHFIVLDANFTSDGSDYDHDSVITGYRRALSRSLNTERSNSERGKK